CRRDCSCSRRIRIHSRRPVRTGPGSRTGAAARCEPASCFDSGPGWNRLRSHVDRWRGLIVSVTPEISRYHLVQELELLEPLSHTHGWVVDPHLDCLTVRVTMRAHTGDRFVLDALCDNYKEFPPLLEFIDVESGARGARTAYPLGTDSFFHSSGP